MRGLGLPEGYRVREDDMSSAGGRRQGGRWGFSSGGAGRTIDRRAPVRSHTGRRDLFFPVSPSIDRLEGWYGEAE